MTFLDMIARPFRSPLLGTALVLVALAVVAVPLHRLTAHGSKAVGNPTVETTTESETTRTVLRIRALDVLHNFEIRTTKDELVYRAETMEPGETEADVDILLEKESVELHLGARAGDKDTAVFITLLPDGREERTAHAIGSGTIEETLRFAWEHEHE